MEDKESVQHVTLEGQVQAVLFQNEESGFAVASLELAAGYGDDENPSQWGGYATVAGEFAPVAIGTYLRLHGKWGNHPRFGRQFQVGWSEHATPTTLEGLEKYLGSGVFPGIGKAMAKKLVRHFGDKTLDALEAGPRKLQKVSGIGPKKAADLYQAFGESRDRHRVMAELRGFGLNAGQANLIYQEWGPAAIEKVKKDPYALIENLRGLGFKTADAMAMKLGIPEDSVVRGRGVIRHLLTEGSREGHVCLPETQIEQKLLSLGMAKETISQALVDLVAEERVCCEETPSDDSPRWFYLPALYEAEVGSSAHITRILNQSSPPLADASTLEAAIQRSAWPPDDTQKKAVQMALQEPFSIVTGGPGTGKTTTLRLLLDVMEAAGTKKVCLASPTGRAAKRLQEATGRKASTLHRLLGWEPGNHAFKHHEDEPLEADFLVVDEVSMLDLPLAHAVLRAVPDSCRVLFVGDADQLPSVGPGKVLRDLVSSPNIPSVRLAHVHRQAAGSGISQAAHEILEGQVPKGCPQGSDGDFFIVTPPDADAASEMVEKLVCDRIPTKYGLDPMKDILVLSPMYKGVLGVDALNEKLGQRMNPDSKPTWAAPFRQGDRMMVVKNDYDREVFNGDTGVVRKITDDQVLVEVDNRMLAYGPDELKSILPAYCVTVHRSQGSESRAVVVVATTSHWIMLRRNLLYTAITRGKELVVVVTDQNALRCAVGNSEENLRFGRLAQRLG
jgi:exodeoxyribonuclease V alpha subunit